MTEIAILIAAIAGATAGGALGARLARAPVWKGAAIAAGAGLVQFAAATVLKIDSSFINTLILLVAAGLIGGRFGLRLTVRQLVLVMIGSFLGAVLAGFIAVYALVWPEVD
ncbi:hypothetical protein ACLBXM_13975 [Xanthobacteraceae bacterium A53D]